jgi:hypothetical protein
MKLNSRHPRGNALFRLHPQHWSNLSAVAPTSTWVRLREQPSPYCQDEALLLCRHSETEWLAWMPDYGELVLHRSQFSSLL